jgi:hypothetical protein
MFMHVPSEYSKAISTIVSWMYYGILVLWAGIQAAIIIKKYGGL